MTHPFTPSGAVRTVQYLEEIAREQEYEQRLEALVSRSSMRAIQRQYSSRRTRPRGYVRPASIGMLVLFGLLLIVFL